MRLTSWQQITKRLQNYFFLKNKEKIRGQQAAQASSLKNR
jgi:hypothetical protein